MPRRSTGQAYQVRTARLLPRLALLAARGSALLALGLLVPPGCGENPFATDGSVSDGSVSDARPVCNDGVDGDGDGYGQGCSAGPDCDDEDPLRNPGQAEICDGKDNNCNGDEDEGVLNACGNCDPACGRLGDGTPFPVDPKDDPNVKDVNGVGLDPNGDLTLDKTQLDFNYMWIANSEDIDGTGTVSKIDTVNLREVARYFTLTCSRMQGSTCLDINGTPIDRTLPQQPSRTAVDFNFDVWVANRVHKKDHQGQPSVTRIANDPADCVDRNSNKTIDTSQDRDDDGQINPDCDGNGQPDHGSTVCQGGDLDGGPPEFYGYDDECVLFTVNFAETAEVGRSVCLDAGPDFSSNAWVGTNNREVDEKQRNRFYRIGPQGQIAGPYELPEGHRPYGCAVDSQGILWSVSPNGRTLAYLNTGNPTQVGAQGIEPPFALSPPAFASFYGISLDPKGRVWLGGWTSGMVYRYTPKRGSFATLDQGSWIGVKEPQTLRTAHNCGSKDKPKPCYIGSRGIAADARGKVWVAIHGGHIWRINQDLPARATPYPASDTAVDGDSWEVGDTSTIGVGVDFKGHVWGVTYDGSYAARLDVDGQGNRLASTPEMTDPRRQVPVGENPYTYSDFTGYGLRNFTRQQGRYQYQFPGCPGDVKATWIRLTWNATTPTGTRVVARVRTGDDEASLSPWSDGWEEPPVQLDSGATKLSENPASLLRVEFLLEANDARESPVLHDFDVTYRCGDDVLH